MIQETYAALRIWEFNQTKLANIERIRKGNLIGAPNANALKNILWSVSSRYAPEGVDRPLALLAQRGLGIDLWKPLLLWHLAQSEELIKRFTLDWLYPRIKEGLDRFQPAEVAEHFVFLLKPGGSPEGPWSESTLKRVSSGLLKLCAAFGLLEGGTVKTAVPYHLPEPCFLYVLRALLDRESNPAKVMEAPDWGIFLMSREAVHQELLRLHQYRKVEYHVVGSLIELRLPAPDLLTFANGWPL
jgi:hypothetical protein